MDNSILKTRRKESRADEIINCATQLFLKNGFEETTFSDIAKEGGMARSTIYLYFKDKNDILKSIIHSSFENHRSLLEKKHKLCQNCLMKLLLQLKNYLMKKNLS